MCTANVFSASAIAEAPPHLRRAMEQVAGRAERLAKDKAKEQVPPPFRTRVTESLYGRVYKSDGKADRAQRAKQREVRQTGISKLGEVEYKRLLQEVDLMTKEKVDIDKIIDKRLKEIEERLQSEENRNQDLMQTRSQAGTSSEEPKTAGKRPRTAEKHPKTAGKRPRTAGKQPKPTDDDQTTDKRPKTTGKQPKTDDDGQIAGKRPKTAGKRPKVAEKETKASDRKGTRKATDDNDDVDKSKSRSKPQVAKKSAPIPLFEDDNEDRLDDLVILEKEQADDDMKDKDYEPEDDEEQEHDNNGDEDDFQVPKLRSRKVLSVRKGKSKTSRDQQDDLEDFETTEKTNKGVEFPEDKTFNLFREIVGEKFASLTTEEFDKFKQDKSINPVEAAGFRVTMKELASRLKEAVEKGQKIEEKYREMIKQTINIARAMEYPGANNVKVKDVLESIPDQSCNAWRLHMRGRTQMDMTDFALDDEEHEADRDLVIQGPMLNEDEVTTAAKHLKSLPTLLKNDAVKLLADLYENQARAHEYAAASCRKLKELHRILPFETFLRVADGAVRPLVIMHIPKTEEIVSKLRTTAERSSRKTTGASTVIEVMEQRNLPQLKKDWTMTDVDKPKKMIACIVFKYVRDAMFPTDTTPTHQVVKKFNVIQTTIHRHMYGKKYPGGGQVLKQMKRRDTKLLQGIRRRVGESTLETEKVEEEKATSTSKGKGGGKSSTTKRSAEEIRGDSTAEGEKVKRKRKKEDDAAEEAELNEDPDMPTAKERAAALASLSTKRPTKGVMIVH